MNDSLFLVRFILSDPLALQRFACNERLPDHPFDVDYTIHCALGGLFGEYAPKPFALVSSRKGELLAYSRLDHETLETHARRFAPPALWKLVQWSSLASKPMPEAWPIGLQMEFSLRACPLVRGPSGHGKGKPAAKPKPEVDAYLAHLWNNDEPAGREEVYVSWLKDEFTRRGGVELLSAWIECFQLRRLLRRDRSRKTRALTRPDVGFRGILKVTDGAGFRETLSRGLGRHRAFGFGMLLLKPRKEL